MIVFSGTLGFLIGGVFLAVPIAMNIALLIGSTLVPPVWPAVGALTSLSLVVLFILHAVAVLVLYALATVGLSLAPTGGVASGPWNERFFRGALIGLNAAVNLAVLSVIPVLALVAIPVALINLMALSNGFAGDPRWQPVLGWASVLMPMSWPTTLIGLAAFLINLVAAVFGTPLRVTMEWSVFVVRSHGGIVHAWWRPPTAYNCGQFSFINGRIPVASPWERMDRTDDVGNPAISYWTADGIMLHENGHAISVASFGSWFWFWGALHQNVWPPVGGSGANAYAELIAESPLRESRKSWLEQFCLIGAPPNVRPLPVATAEPAFSTQGDIIDLNAAGSSDPDTFPLGRLNPTLSPPVGFFWRLRSRPQGSLAVIAEPNASATSFQSDIGGDYRIEVAITDGIEGQTLNEAGAANLMTGNRISVVGARANGPYSGVVAAPVELSAAGSDAGSLGILPSALAPGAPPDSPPPLSLQWLLASVPAGSGASATISDPNAEQAQFLSDVPGDYLVALEVATPAGPSDMEVTRVSLLGANPNGPYASTAGSPVTVTAAGSEGGTLGGLPSVLAASGSTRPPLTVLWQSPSAEIAFSDASSETPELTANAAGSYPLTLTVTTVDGLSHSATTTVTLT